MSTTELNVPREFLPAFVIAAGLNVSAVAEPLGNDLSLDYSEENRATDDEMIAELVARLDARAAILRAVDHDVPVPASVLKDAARYALEHYECELDGLCVRRSPEAPSDPDRIVEVAQLRCDLAAWLDENAIAPETVTA